MKISVYLILAMVAGRLSAADYTIYIGDSNEYRVAAITTDTAGNTYAAGSRVITGTGGAAGTPLSDIFVTKVDPSGTILFTTTISGKATDQAAAIALDPSGNIYVGGSTSSKTFPIRNALQSDPSPSSTGFLVKLNPDGGTVAYSTYFGGTLALSSVNALATDSKGALYVTGTTYASDFPHSDGLPGGRVGFNTVPMASGAFFAKITSAGDKILYSGVIAGGAVSCGAGSSCFLSARVTSGVGIAVDPVGNAYIAGNSNTTDLPATQGALLMQGTGAFVAKINAAGTALSYLTDLGAGNYILTPFANPANTLSGIAVDFAGDAFLVGSTNDPAFPATPAAYQPVFAGPLSTSPPGPPRDAFVAKLKPDGSGMAWATFLGGISTDAAQALAVDLAGNVWVTGTTSSASFPNATGWSQGGDFLVEVGSAGSTLPYSARFPDGSISQSVAVDKGGHVHVAGLGGLVSSITPSQPFTIGSFGIANSASGPVSGRISPGELISLYGPHVGPASPVSATIDGSGFIQKALGGVQVLIDNIPAPLLYASDTQINAIVPFQLPPGDSAVVQIVKANATTGALTAAVDSTAPAIFQNPNNSALAVNGDGTINAMTNPAKPGSVVSIWANGTGANSFFADGQIPTAAQDYFCCQVQAGAGPAEVLYAGASPTLVAGVTQINFRVPAQFFSGPMNLTVTAGGRTSATVYIYVTRSEPPMP